MAEPAVLRDPLAVRARTSARLLFAKSNRKAGGEPYFNHLENVAKEAAKYSDVPEVIAAAYLHDAVEDELTTGEAIEQEFGPRVRELVLSVTEEKLDDWKARKAAYVAKIDNLETAIIAGADKVDNLRDLLQVTDWSVFNAERDAKVEHYRHVANAVAKLQPELGKRVFELCDKLDAQPAPPHRQGQESQ